MRFVIKKQHKSVTCGSLLYSYRNKAMIVLTLVFFLICYAVMTALVLRFDLLITLGHKYHIHCFRGLENVGAIGKTKVRGIGATGQGTIRYRKKKLCSSTRNVSHFEEEKRSRCTETSYVCVSLLRQQAPWQGQRGESSLFEWGDQ